MVQRRGTFNRSVEAFSTTISRWTGSTGAFALALAVVVIWAVTGPLFGFSDSWQLVINTGTTVVTFLMVFLIQRAQNKDAMAIQLKLNELVAAMSGASNGLISIEDLSEDELQVLHRHYSELAKMSRKHTEIRRSHSIEEAKARHSLKHESRASKR